MPVNCLSVPNPISYLVCYGIKDVENRTWRTDYRGTLYIHSAGRISFRGMPDFSRFPMPVMREFDTIMSQIQDIEQQSSYIGFVENGVTVMLQREEKQPISVINEYALLSDVYNHYRSEDQDPFFHAGAIIGSVELSDIVNNSDSAWAEEGKFHWVLSNPVRFKIPLANIPERSGIWKHEL
ncbi:MAG: hypothetical protein EA384_10115 [Spirochaetaceae bacterium]|nr:MAG: hypothetical protein EA384_10115 [Spirochaetaceae bacterium]